MIQKRNTASPKTGKSKTVSLIQASFVSAQEKRASAREMGPCA